MKKDYKERFSEIKAKLSGKEPTPAGLTKSQVEALELQVEATVDFNQKSSWLSVTMIGLVVVTIAVALSGLWFDAHRTHIKKGNLHFALYKELSYNKGIVDMISNKAAEFEKDGYVFLRDFQFESYRGLLQNMDIRGGLAENIMDAYRRMGIMQNGIEAGRRYPQDSSKYHVVVLENRNPGLMNSLEASIKGLKNPLFLPPWLGWKAGFSIIGVFCILAGTYVLSRNLFFKGLKGEVQKKVVQNDEPINRIYKIIASKMFGYGVKGVDILQIFEPTDPHTQSIKKQSVYEPIRGLAWIFIGAVFHITSITGWSVNLVIIIGLIIISVPIAYLVAYIQHRLFANRKDR